MMVEALKYAFFLKTDIYEILQELDDHRILIQFALFIQTVLH